MDLHGKAGKLFCLQKIIVTLCLVVKTLGSLNSNIQASSTELIALGPGIEAGLATLETLREITREVVKRKAQKRQFQND